MPSSLGKHGLFAAPAVLGVLFGLTGHPLLWFFLTVVAVSLVMDPAWESLPANVPAAAVCLVACLTAVAVAASVVDATPLGDVGSSRAILALSSAVAGVLLAHRWPQRSVPSDRWRDRVWLIPAVWLTGVGAAAALAGPGRRSGWVFGGDHLRHLGLIVGEWHVGALSYDILEYPRGWHTLLTLMWSATGPRIDGHGFAGLVAVVAASCWFCFVLLVVGVAHTARGLALALHGGPVAAGWCGALAGILASTPPFMADYLAKGFETSVLATLCVVVVGDELLQHRGSARALLVCMLAGVVVANAWQPLLPVVVVAVVVAGISWARQGPCVGALAGVTLVGVLGFLTAAPALRAVLTPDGVEHIAAQGDVPPLPLAWVGMSTAALVVVLVQDRQVAPGDSTRRVGVVGLVIVLSTAILVGPAMALAGHVSLTSYYPNKAIWAAAVLGLPFVAVFVVLVLRALNATRGPWRLLLVPLGGVVGVAAVLGLVPPVLTLGGGWSTVDADEVIAAVAAPGAERADVVFTGRGRMLDATVQSALEFYRGGAATEVARLPSMALADECQRLHADTDPGVLTMLAPVQVVQRYACVQGLTVVRIPVVGP